MVISDFGQIIKRPHSKMDLGFLLGGNWQITNNVWDIEILRKNKWQKNSHLTINDEITNDERGARKNTTK